ncbi:M3 family metallopeptidase [Salmonella enterica]
MSTNPLLDQSMLPYQAPRFDRIKDCHYRPAFDEGVRQKRVEIEAIVNHPTAPDFTNTLLALEQSGALLSRVTSIFFAMTAAHTNDELQRLDEAFSAELAALSNDIYLNSALFARVDAVWQQRHSLGLDDESLRLVDVIHQRFVLAGAQLAEEDKARLKVLNTESATLMSQFNQRLLAASLQEKMRKASLFNKGYDMTELLGAALLDMRWHMLEESVAEQSVAEFEQQALAAEHLDLPAVPPRYRSSYFAHIFGGGYAAGYYAYLWTQMLADDGYQWFVEQGGLTRENGQRFRDVILSRGNSTDLETLYSAWRGHEPHIDPMLQYRGLDR